MTKQVKYDKRVFLPKGAQRKFIESVQVKLDTGIDDIAGKIGVHRRTLFDWRREKYLISKSGLSKLSKLGGLPVPSGIKIKDPFWYTNLGANKGWFTIQKRYGRIPVDEAYRKKKWYEWWQNKGKFQDRDIFHPLPFNKPSKSEKLAEFMGIMMGDGGMSRYQICITLHHIDDLEFSKYVMRLIKKLFDINPGLNHDYKNSVFNIVVSRTELVKYLNNLGLVIGNKVKQKFDIPSWVKDDDNFLKMCIRGLVDTDGCVFTHGYKVNGKWYKYKKLCFTSASLPLILSVQAALAGWGFKPRLAKKGGEIREVRLDSKQDIFNYFNIIGSSNPKHLKRYQN